MPAYVEEAQWIRIPEVSQECFSSSLLLQVHTMFPHDFWFLLGGLCKPELLIPVLASEDESTPQLVATNCFRKDKGKLANFLSQETPFVKPASRDTEMRRFPFCATSVIRTFALRMPEI